MNKNNRKNLKFLVCAVIILCILGSGSIIDDGWDILKGLLKIPFGKAKYVKILDILAKLRKSELKSFIKYKGDGFFLIDSAKRIPLLKFYKSEDIWKIKRRDSSYSLVFYCGKINKDIASLFNSKNISFVINYQKFFRNTYMPRKKIRLIFIASEKVETELIPIVKEMKYLPNSKIVENRIDLFDELHDIKRRNENAIVVFNHKRNSEIVKTFMEYRKNMQFRNIDVLTCNSYSIEGPGFTINSTGYIYLKDVIESLKRIHDGHPCSINDFWINFVCEHERCIMNRYIIENCFIITSVGIGVFVTAVVLIKGCDRIPISHISQGEK